MKTYEKTITVLVGAILGILIIMLFSIHKGNNNLASIVNNFEIYAEIQE